MKTSLLSALLLLATGARAQTRPPDFGQDWPKEAARWASSKPLKNERTLGAPPFSTLPFLTLHPGDRLVEGRVRWRDFKAGTNKISAPAVYLWHGQERYEISYEGKQPQIAEISQLFAWTFSSANAQALFALRSRFEIIPVSSKQWRLIKARLQKEWPATLRDDSGLSLAPPRFQNGRATFAELLYDNWNNRLLFRRTSLSPQGMWSKDWFLVVGPHRVDNFDIDEHRGGGINGPPGFLPGELERNRRDYAAQQRFRTLVGEVLPRVKPAGDPAR